MEYKAPDNIYWLFSSSAQAIAAFIGFLTAGFYFVLDKMDDQIKKDSTLEEIIQEIKQSHFKKLKTLSILTGASILFSLGLVFLNGYDYFLKNIFVVLVSLINIITISWAILFVIRIVDPNKINKTAKKLIKENKDLFEIKSANIGDSVKIGDFIEQFNSLAKLVNELGFLNETPSARRRITAFGPLGDTIRMIFQSGLIDKQTYEDLNEVLKIRNLADHGEIDRVDIRINNLVLDLIKKLVRINNENN